MFIDFEVDGVDAGRVIILLYDDMVPRTVKNFKALISGSKGYGYCKSRIHRIVPGFVIQGGDFTRGDGRGGFSIYGDKFEDESFKVKHDKPGILSMANSGPNTNGSQFFITLQATPFLDDKHVAFGEVLKGFELIKKIETLGSESESPSRSVIIKDCGIID